MAEDEIPQQMFPVIQNQLEMKQFELRHIDSKVETLKQKVKEASFHINKPMKKCLKKPSLKVTKKLILQEIRTMQLNYVTTEDLSASLQIEKGVISTVIQELMRTGFLRKMKNKPPHDTYREWLTVGCSGWQSTYYEVIHC